MTSTPFDPNNKEFTDTVHRDYRDFIYPPLFGLSKDAITYDEVPLELMEEADRYLGLDCMVHTKFKGMLQAISHSVSFRMRDAEKFQHWQDLTITEANEASGMVGELSKIVTELFTYGYFSFVLKRLVEVIVVDMPDLKMAYARGEIPYRRSYNPRTSQPFVCFLFDDLKRLSLVRLHLKEVDGMLVSQPKGLT